MYADFLGNVDPVPLVEVSIGDMFVTVLENWHYYVDYKVVHRKNNLDNTLHKYTPVYTQSNNINILVNVDIL